MKPRATLVWFFFGLIVAGAVHLIQGTFLEPSVTLRVGIESPALSFVTSELGPIPVTRGVGHDGQFAYVLARLPLDLQAAAEYADVPAYRYRRPLYSWLSGGLGLLGPHATLWAMIGLSILAFGLAAAAAARLARQLDSRWWIPVGVVANLGLILAVQLTTVDTLACAFGLWALSCWLEGRRWLAVAALGAAGLTKEVYLLFAAGIAFGEVKAPVRDRFALLFLGVLPVLAWSGILSWTLPGMTTTNGNLGLPLVGFLDGVRFWQAEPDVVLGFLSLLTVIGGLIAAIATRSRLVRWSIVPWLGIALISTTVVWGGANNALRAFAPLWFLVVLEAGRQVQYRSTQSRLRDLPSQSD